MRRDDLMPSIKDSRSYDYLEPFSDTNSRFYGTPVFPTIAFLGMALVLVFLLNFFYKSKHKPTRRKKPRLRRTLFFGTKVPGV